MSLSLAVLVAILLTQVSIRAQESFEVVADGSKARFVFADPDNWDALFGNISLRGLASMIMETKMATEAAASRLTELESRATASEARAAAAEAKIAMLESMLAVCSSRMLFLTN
jgi:hypothetical protein